MDLRCPATLSHSPTTARAYLVTVTEVFMPRFVVLFFVTLLSTGIASGTATTSPEAALDEKLNSTVRNYSISSENLLQALARVSAEFQLRMGIEWEFSPVPYHEVALNYDKTTPRQIIQDLIAIEPSYAVSIANGVVHVSRNTIFDDKRNFLNLVSG